MRTIISTFMLGIVGLPLSSMAADSEGNWFLRPYLGISQMSDIGGISTDIGTADGVINAELDSGFVTGLGLGYQYNDRVAVEFAWEYRTNDSQVTLADGQIFEDGNYASISFFLNGYYFLPTETAWTPYIGAGIGFLKEIDIDLERGGVEQSFSGDGEVGFQVFVGGEYAISEKFSFTGELRYTRFDAGDLVAESAMAGQISGFDYDPITLQVGLRYSF